MSTLSDRIRGSVLAHALGDALGAPFEFAPLDAVRQATGTDWIDRLHPCTGQVSPHGPWVAPAPPGTGTDDLRYNRVFIDLAVETRAGTGRPMPAAAALARRLLEVVERPGVHFPGFEALAGAQFGMWEGVSRGVLGETSRRYPGVSASALSTRSVGLNVPTIAGLLLLPSAGLLFPGDPEGAYVAAYETAFFDVGYAREATALFAAAQSLAASGEALERIVEVVTAMDPLQLAGPFGDPFVKQRLGPLLAAAGRRRGRALADWLSRELRVFGVFDPLRALAVTLAALRAHAEEPDAALQVAVNQVDRGLDGAPRRMGDIDCHGSITGALLGTLHGAKGLPAAMLGEVVRSNREVYDIDLDSLGRSLAAALPV